MALVGVEGSSALPDNCLLISGCFFLLAMCINLARDLLPHKYGRWMPNCLAMALVSRAEQHTDAVCAPLVDLHCAALPVPSALPNQLLALVPA